MFVPTITPGPIVDADGMPTPAFQLFLDQLVQNMQQALSNEGFLIPSLIPSDIALIEDGALNGTVIFDSTAINGGSFSHPNGQLYVKLGDGTFHPIVNT